MELLSRCKENILYTWNTSPTFRHCVILTACLCCGICCCLTAGCGMSSCGPRPSTRLPRRFHSRQTITSDINKQRRIRRVRLAGNKKRSVSVDRGRRWSRKGMAKDQFQSPLFGMWPTEIRLKVYELALRDGEDLCMRPNEDDGNDYWDVRPEPGCKGTSLLRSCKRMSVNSLLLPLLNSPAYLLTTQTAIARPYQPSTLATLSTSIPAPRYTHGHPAFCPGASTPSKTSPLPPASRRTTGFGLVCSCTNSSWDFSVKRLVVGLCACGIVSWGRRT
jgi:hypothetical protein